MNVGQILGGVAAIALAIGAQAQGDPMGEGWAFRAMERPEVPRSGAGDGENPIDAFIRIRLGEEGIEPAPRADRRALIRRASFDLTGLPPSPEEIEAFAGDETPGAYERLVDRMLASPAYGERWARHWLDVARFGESDGYEYDHLRERAWPYRDYVIRSLNEDRPYGDFVRDQIAGDLGRDAGEGEIAATGFLVAGPWDEANNIQASATMRARTREDEVEDMVAAVAQTFLGVTVNCARCHDHKFDPIPQVDYYRMASALAGVRHGERPAIPPREVDRRAAERDDLSRELGRLDRQVADLEAAGRGRLPRDPGEIEAPTARLRWSFEDGAEATGIASRLVGGAEVSGGVLRLSGAGAYLEAGPLPGDLEEKTLEAWARVADLDRRGGAVISVQQKGGPFDAIVLGEREPRVWMAGSENFRRTEDLHGRPEDANGTIHLAVSYAKDGSIQVYREGIAYGPAYRPAGAPARFVGKASAVLIGLRHSGAGNGFFAGEVEEARIYDRALSADEVAASHRAGPRGASLGQVLAAMTEEEKGRRDEAIRRRPEIRARVERLRDVPLVYAASPKEPGVTHVLRRGDVEKPGEAVAAGGLSAVNVPSADLGVPADAPEGDRRRKLADWVASRDNPLTYRAMANRVWHYHFGTGIVSTPNDLGAGGESPSHPELLDWLACELRDNGGSLKALHRVIMASEAYRRSSRFDARAAKKDADSRLLWRFPPRRLEAEAIRDAALAASGDLNPTMLGPSVRPFTVRVFGSNIYTLKDGDGPEYRRRTIYRMNVQSAKDPLLESLDCPDPSVKAPKRGVTTTPLQALSLMNDPFVARRATGLAERTRREAGDDPGRRVDRAYLLALGRRPTVEERGRAVALAKDHGMDQVAWVLLNASEFSYVH